MMRATWLAFTVLLGSANAYGFRAVRIAPGHARDGVASR
jgi:hypothetical protein